MLKYNSFDDWFNETQGFSLRSEYLFAETKRYESLIKWLKACWDAAREKGEGPEKTIVFFKNEYAEETMYFIKGQFHVVSHYNWGTSHRIFDWMTAYFYCGLSKNRTVEGDDFIKELKWAYDTYKECKEVNTKPMPEKVNEDVNNYISKLKRRSHETPH